MTSLFCSASTTASCTHFIAVSKSTISPLRTPRDGAWPTPRILIVPSGFPSPTTTQIFEVPISRPTIKLLLAITVAFLVKTLKWDRPPHRQRRRAGVEFLYARTVGERLLDRRMNNRFRFADLGFQPSAFGFMRRRAGSRGRDHLQLRFELRNDCGSRLRKSDRDVAGDKQIDGLDRARRIIAVDKKLLEP